MRRAVLLIGLVLGTGTPVLADDVPSVDTPQLHCSDWKRVAPHVWTQTGVINENGRALRGSTLDNTDQSRMLDMLCTG